MTGRLVAPGDWVTKTKLELTQGLGGIIEDFVPRRGLNTGFIRTTVHSLVGYDSMLFSKLGLEYVLGNRTSAYKSPPSRLTWYLSISTPSLCCKNYNMHGVSMKSSRFRYHRQNWRFEKDLGLAYSNNDAFLIENHIVVSKPTGRSTGKAHGTSSMCDNIEWTRIVSGHESIPAVVGMKSTVNSRQFRPSACQAKQQGALACKPIMQLTPKVMTST